MLYHIYILIIPVTRFPPVTPYFPIVLFTSHNNYTYIDVQLILATIHAKNAPPITTII